MGRGCLASTSAMEKIRRSLDTQDADAAERGFEHFVAAGHRAGVRGRRLGRRRVRPALITMIGLQRDLAGRGKKRRASPIDSM